MFSPRAFEYRMSNQEMHEIRKNATPKLKKYHIKKTIFQNP